MERSPDLDPDPDLYPSTGTFQGRIGVVAVVVRRTREAAAWSSTHDGSAKPPSHGSRTAAWVTCSGAMGGCAEEGDDADRSKPLMESTASAAAADVEVRLLVPCC